MAVRTFPDIADSRIVAEEPVNESLVADLHDRDEALIAISLDTRFQEGTTPDTSWAEIARVKLWFPAAVSSAKSTAPFVVVFERKITGAGLGEVRMRLDGGTNVATSTFSNTAYAFDTLTIPSADVKANANAEVDLIVEAQTSSGATSVEARCLSSASRLAPEEVP